MWAATKSLLEAQTGGALRRRRAALWVAIVAAVVCGALWAFYPLVDARERLAAIPLVADTFNGTDVPLTPVEQQILGRVALVHRQYARDGREFYVTMIDGTRHHHAVHDPRYCFQGAGWRVLNEQKLALPGGEATWLRATRGEAELQSVFWFADGGARHTSVLRYWWRTTLRRMTLGRSGPEPVLIVLQSFGPDQPDWPQFAPEVIDALRL